MSIDTAEIRALRTALRDLVALAAIPAALARREPAAVAAGLADTLLELFQLDFVFVRLRLPGVTGGVDVTRGNAWETFSELLARDHAESSRLSGIETFPDVDGMLDHAMVLPFQSVSMLKAASLLRPVAGPIFPPRPTG